MPMSRHARMMRTAISPLLAMSTFCTACGLAGLIASERDVAVFLGWVLVALGVERGEAVDQLRACLVRPDDFVDEAALRRHVGVRELLAVLRNLRGARVLD